MGIYECLNLYKAVNTDIMLLVKDKSATWLEYLASATSNPAFKTSCTFSIHTISIFIEAIISNNLRWKRSITHTKKTQNNNT